MGIVTNNIAFELVYNRVTYCKSVPNQRDYNKMEIVSILNFYTVKI